MEFKTCIAKCSKRPDVCPPTSDPEYGGSPARVCCINSTWYRTQGGQAYSSQNIPDGENVAHLCPKGQVYKVFNHNKCGCSDESDSEICTWGPWSNETLCTSCDQSCSQFCLRYRKKHPPQNNGNDCVGPSMEYAIRKCIGGDCVNHSSLYLQANSTTPKHEKDDQKNDERISLKPKRCWGYGDVHHSTFDGLKYDFQGVCKYTLVEDITQGFFRVFVKNRKWKLTGTSVTQYVEIHIAGDVVILDGPGLKRIKVNGNHIKQSSLPYNNARWYTANVVSNSLTFESTPLSLSIKFIVHPYSNRPAAPGYGDVWVTLGRQWMQKVDGLCKNYDDIIQNDWKDKNGNYLAEKDTNKESLLGTSYKVNDPQEPRCVDIVRTKTLPSTPIIMAAASKFCRSIIMRSGFFKQVVDRMTVEEIKTWEANCKMDLNAEPKARCDILEAFVITYRNNARDIIGWRENFNCTIEC
ncbi:unnamed protein product, partial [Owenia fusiformis]